MPSRNAGPAFWSVSIRRRCGASVRPTTRISARPCRRSRRCAAGSAIGGSVCLLERKGMPMNPKKLYRLYREDGLSVRRKRARGTRTPRPHALMPNQRWSLEFGSAEHGTSNSGPVLTGRVPTGNLRAGTLVEREPGGGCHDCHRSQTVRCHHRGVKRHRSGTGAPVSGNGHDVLITAENQGHLEAAAAALSSEQGTIATHASDLSTEEGCRACRMP